MKTITFTNSFNFKALFLTLMVLTIATEVSFGQATSESVKGIFEFETLEIDYGTIEKGANGDRSFTFANKGATPIVISDIKTSCGCTVASKPKGPIMPGETATIGVNYKTSRVGAFTKSITVLSNASEPVTVLKIKGIVVDSENKLGE